MALYSDLNILTPEKSNILYDVDAVYQSIIMLLNTAIGERLFRPSFGNYLDEYLFEPCDNITAFKILNDINNTLKQEPRVILNTGLTTVIPIPSEKKFEIALNFSIIGYDGRNFSLDLTLKQNNL